MTFVVRLPSGFSQSFRKDRFIQFFPTCVLTTALEGDCEAKEIVVTNPVVTSEHLRYLGLITRYGGYTKPPRGLEKEQAGQYLNLPWLEFHDRPSVERHTYNPLTEVTPENAVNWGAKTCDDVVATWAIRLLGVKVNGCSNAITHIILNGSVAVFTELLRAGLDIKTAKVSRLLSHPIMNSFVMEREFEDYQVVQLLTWAYTQNGWHDHLAMFNAILERELVSTDAALELLQGRSNGWEHPLELYLLKLVKPEQYEVAYMHVGHGESIRWIADHRPDIYAAVSQHAVENNWEDYFDDLKHIDASELNELADRAARWGHFAIYEKLAPYHSDIRKRDFYGDCHYGKFGLNNAILAIGADPCITKEMVTAMVKRAYFPSRCEKQSSGKPVNGDKLVMVWGPDILTP